MFRTNSYKKYEARGLLGQSTSHDRGPVLLDRVALFPSDVPRGRLCPPEEPPGIVGLDGVISTLLCVLWFGVSAFDCLQVDCWIRHRAPQARILSTVRGFFPHTVVRVVSPNALRVNMDIIYHRRGAAGNTKHPRDVRTPNRYCGR